MSEEEIKARDTYLNGFNQLAEIRESLSDILDEVFKMSYANIKSGRAMQGAKYSEKQINEKREEAMVVYNKLEAERNLLF